MRFRSLEDQQQAVKTELDVLSDRATKSDSKLVAHKASVLEEALSDPEADPKTLRTTSATPNTASKRNVIDGRIGAREAFVGVPDYILNDRLLQEVDSNNITQEQAKDIWLNTR